MSELDTIQSTLLKTARRRRSARALRGLWQGLLVGAMLCALLVGAYRVFPLPLWTLPAAALIPLPCMAIGAVLGGWRTMKLSHAARWVDGQQQLKERLSTALELASQENAGMWRDLIIADAAAHATQVDSRKLVPFHLPRAARWALALLTLAAGLGFVPEYRSKAYLSQQADKQNIKDVGRQLADLTRRNLETRRPALEPAQKAVEAVADVGDKLAKSTLTRSEALKDLSNAAERLKQEMKQLGADPALKKLEQSASGSTRETAANLQKQLESLQKQLGERAGNPDALDRIQKELEKLQMAAKALADSKSSSGQTEKEKLSASLSALSQQMKDLGMQLPQIEDAINALANSQTDMVLKDLQAAANDLEKMRDMAKSMQQIQQQIEKLGKDLGEQLANGQPEAAQSTLQKMIEQLRSANLPPEELDKILQEVSRAVKPAQNYGNVAEHLKSAAAQMRSDKAQAAEALAAAAKELSQLAQSMQDMEALQAEMQALSQASMCIGTGQSWCRANRPGSKPGGKPGSGVGTWADDNATWDGDFTDRWDNSGQVRPDMAARGQTEREQRDLSDALKPTKVKGQFSPGNQMPSVTLKGVSIRGQSTIEYEAASAAAQSEAESAVTQDKVPRAYQGAVRDYFDDLKK